MENLVKTKSKKHKNGLIENKTIPLFELKKVQTNFPAIKITNSCDAANFIRQFYNDDIGIFESAFILLINQGGNTVGYAKISQGGIAGTVIDSLLVVKYAVDSLAKRVIIAHNHPSGNLNPSEPDKNITKKIKDCLSVLEIQFADHIILTEGSYFSFADEGLL